jgi:hypothetical protein
VPCGLVFTSSLISTPIFILSASIPISKVAAVFDPRTGKKELTSQRVFRRIREKTADQVEAATSSE